MGGRWKISSLFLSTNSVSHILETMQAAYDVVARKALDLRGVLLEHYYPFCK